MKMLLAVAVGAVDEPFGGWLLLQTLLSYGQTMLCVLVSDLAVCRRRTQEVAIV